MQNSPLPSVRRSSAAATVFRVVTGIAALVLGVSLALTMFTSVDASSCQLTATDTSEGLRPTIPETAPVYLEVMSGDTKLNRKLREMLEKQLQGHEIVERSARHAPKGAVGLKLIVTLWAPKWMPFWGRGTTTLESELRVGTQKLSKKTTLAVSCTGLVNKEGFLAAEGDRMVEWTVGALGL